MFSGCTYVTIPDNVTSIGYKAFYSCTNLTSILFERKNISSSLGYAECLWNIPNINIITVA